MDRLLAGATAGLVATVPMTVLMHAWHAGLPADERHPLPPERITHRASRAVGASAHPHRSGWDAKTHVAHFGFGATAGAAYAGLRLDRLPVPAPVKGAAFGLGVWAASYLGWLPAVGLHPSAADEPAGRNALMVAAHLVWGATAAAVADRLARHPPRPSYRHRPAGARTGR